MIWYTDHFMNGGMNGGDIMAIYIKFATMPTSCHSCPFENGGDCYGGKAKYIMDIDDDEELYHTKRHLQCPLIEIPEPHGRLIDECQIVEALDKYKNYINLKSDINFLRVLVDCIEKIIELTVPTVIRGSEEDENR